RGSWVRALVAIAAGIAVGALIAPVVAPVLSGRPRDAVSQAIGAAFARAPASPVGRFYYERGERPLWITDGKLAPAAAELVSVLKDARDDDLEPAAYGIPRLQAEIKAAGGKDAPGAMAAADIDLSRAYASYIGDLHRPDPAAPLQWVDPAVRLAPTDPLAILEAAARAPSLTAALAEARLMNPIYTGLRAALLAERENGDQGGRDALLAANLERARALPPSLGARYILVNPAAESLWFVDHGAPPQTMQIIVGMTDDQTPSMIGLIRDALFNPYWNVPPALTSQKIAPEVLRHGTAYLRRQHFEVLADWQADAEPIDPATVDWRTIAAGGKGARVRQLPGPDNMMGEVKFMLPNPLGIYLHDTPEKGLFDASVRTDSHGCVRLKNALRLAQWIFGHPIQPATSGTPDQKADIDPPIPVYILYLTAQPGPGGVTFLPDIYHRDPALLAALVHSGHAGFS
ncbi:MAG: L,D-transpeptidase family protein, partial [Caulobacteraceae bacterium]